MPDWVPSSCRKPVMCEGRVSTEVVMVTGVTMCHGGHDVLQSLSSYVTRATDQ